MSFSQAFLRCYGCCWHRMSSETFSRQQHNFLVMHSLTERNPFLSVRPSATICQTSSSTTDFIKPFLKPSQAPKKPLKRGAEQRTSLLRQRLRQREGPLLPLLLLLTAYLVRPPLKRQSLRPLFRQPLITSLEKYPTAPLNSLSPKTTKNPPFWDSTYTLSPGHLTAPLFLPQTLLSHFPHSRQTVVPCNLAEGLAYCARDKILVNPKPHPNPDDPQSVHKTLPANFRKLGILVSAFRQA